MEYILLFLFILTIVIILNSKKKKTLYNVYYGSGFTHIFSGSGLPNSMKPICYDNI